MAGRNIFDQRMRRLRQRSARACSVESRHLHDELADYVLDRLLDVSRCFKRILVIGVLPARLVSELNSRYNDPSIVHCGNKRTTNTGVSHVDGDATTIPFRHGSFDLVLCMFEHHVTDDLPGSLIQLRQVLEADGMMLSVFPGGSSLQELRYALMQAEMETSAGSAARVLPWVDIRDAGDLLRRAGFALPVAEVERLNLTYPHPLAAIADLRRLGETNPVRDALKIAISRPTLQRFLEISASELCDHRGRFQLTVDLLFLTGWAPDPGQQQPMQRGTALQRLADALRPKNEST